MASLTTHDLTILQKIADPESGPSAPLLIDSSLPKDPHYPDPETYASITSSERAIITSIQEIELQTAGLKATSMNSSLDLITIYQTAVTSLSSLISEYPHYASARNNRAQVLRRLYGDLILVENSPEPSTALQSSSSESERILAATALLTDLDTAISLLTPSTPFSPLSSTAAKTLSQAYTQRGALYHLTVKAYSHKDAKLRVDDSRREGKWTVVMFEENASRDFMMGGRLGNEVARQMAVVANPTAKLCGDVVREAMRTEFAGLGT